MKEILEMLIYIVMICVLLTLWANLWLDLVNKIKTKRMVENLERKVNELSNHD